MSLLVLAILVLGPFKPEPTLTPGVVRPLSTIEVCTTKWRLDRRHVTDGMRRRVAARYGVPWAKRHLYEFDHLIPRSLAGADDEANLWPQPLYEAKHKKDPAEVALSKAVCSGRMTLNAAQDLMRHWGR